MRCTAVLFSPLQSLRDSSPKGALFVNIVKLPATAKAVPLGKVALPQAMTEGVFPQHRAFAESGAANAVPLYDPIRENGVQKRPQAFLNPEI